MRLDPGDVRCWLVPLDLSEERCAELYARGGLSADEQQRGERFRVHAHARRYVVARAALRELLGRYVGADPETLGFVYNAFGKPELVGEFGPGEPLEFNVSHSGELAVIAVARGRHVGVDIERLRPEPDHAAIARAYFSTAEVAQLDRAPAHLRTEAFFRCWTQREACVKAGGAGLEESRANVSAGWSVYALDPAPGYVGALAVGEWQRVKQRAGSG